MAIAKMGQGEFAQAVTLLRQVEANYGRSAGPKASDEFQMIETMNQAKGRLLLAVALFRNGQREASLALTKEAVAQLSSVQEDGKIQKSIRDNAGIYLAQGREQLEQLQQALAPRGKF